MPKKRAPTAAAVAADLEDFKGEVRDSIDKLQQADARLLKCMDEMKASQAQAATKADLTRTETLIIGALDRAFNRLRNRQAAVWVTIAVLVVIAAVSFQLR